MTVIYRVKQQHTTMMIDICHSLGFTEFIIDCTERKYNLITFL